MWPNERVTIKFSLLRSFVCALIACQLTVLTLLWFHLFFISFSRSFRHDFFLFFLRLFVSFFVLFISFVSLCNSKMNFSCDLTPKTIKTPKHVHFLSPNFETEVFSRWNQTEESGKNSIAVKWRLNRFPLTIFLFLFSFHYSRVRLFSIPNSFHTFFHLSYWNVHFLFAIISLLCAISFSLFLVQPKMYLIVPFLFSFSAWNSFFFFYLFNKWWHKFGSEKINN